MPLYKTAMELGYYRHLSMRNSRLGVRGGGSSIHRPGPVSFSTALHTQRKLDDTAILLSKHRPVPQGKGGGKGDHLHGNKKDPTPPGSVGSGSPGKGRILSHWLPRVLSLQKLLIIQSTAPVLCRFRFLEQQASRHDAGPRSS